MAMVCGAWEGVLGLDIWLAREDWRTEASKKGVRGLKRRTRGETMETSCVPGQEKERRTRGGMVRTLSGETGSYRGEKTKGRVEAQSHL